jgi:hypothetical protein
VGAALAVDDAPLVFEALVKVTLRLVLAFSER